MSRRKELLDGHRPTSLNFLRQVGYASKASQPTTTPATQEQQPVNPIKGCLNASELLIAQQLANPGGSATIEAIRKRVAETLARPNYPTRNIAEGLRRLAKIGACVPEPPLSDGSTSWRLADPGLLAAARQFTSK